MTPDRRQVLAGLLAAALPAGAWARGPAYARTRALLEAYVADGRIAGAVAGFVRRGRFAPDYVSAGRVAFAADAPAVGTSNAIAGSAADAPAVGPDTLWRIYSMTKPITGMAVMRAIHDGKLRLDQPLADIYPEYARMGVLTDPAVGLAARDAATPITIRHLLTHTSGLAYGIAPTIPLEREYRRLGLLPGVGRFGLQPGDGMPPDLQGFAKALAALPLVTEPGTTWRYSVSLDLLGAVLERVHGRTLDRVLADAVTGPAGMADTGFVVPAADLPRLSALPVMLGGRLREVDGVRVGGRVNSEWAAPPLMFSGGGGMVSSARDYLRFAQMVLDGGRVDGRAVFPPAAVALGASDLLPPGVSWNKAQGFGAGGRFMRTSLPTGESAGSYGWGGAAGTAFVADRQRGVGLVLMVQFIPDTIYKLRDEYRDAWVADLG